MRRTATVAVVFVAAVFLGVVLTGPAAAQTASAPDCSTVGYEQNADGEYKVTNVSQLQCIGDETNGPGLDQDYVLVSDINASGTDQWNDGDGFEPIGTDSSRFTGTFDGANHTIADLRMDRTAEAVGLFGFTGTDAEIRNVTFRNANVTYGDFLYGGGILVGNNKGAVTNVTASGTVVIADDGYDAGGLVGINEGTIGFAAADVDLSQQSDSVSTRNVGGLVGTQQAGGTVHNSSATGDVAIGTDDSVGGLVGSNGQFGVSVIRDSYATGDVVGNDGVGGLAGDQQSDDAIIERSYATGNVTGDGGEIGGLVGEQYRGTIEESYAAGNVTWEDGASNVGGFAGSNEDTINGSYANGTVTGNDGVEAQAEQVGGFVGLNEDGTIRESFAAGDVTGTNNVGGFAGENTDSFETATINESYATGSVNGNERVGGFVGLNAGNVTDAYATGDVTADTDLGGVVGENRDVVKRVYAAGAVNPTNADTAGGLIGQNGEDGEVTFYGADDGENGTVRDSYWDESTTGQANAVGKDGDDASDGEQTASGGDSILEGEVEGLRSTQLKANTSLAGYDFTNTWDAVDDPADGNQVSYPFLQANTQEPTPGLETLYAGGDGTESDPYEIENWTHLDNVRANLEAEFVLVSTLNSTTDGYDDVASNTANGGDGFVPIGSDGGEFTGEFDGQEYAIAGLVINRSSTTHVGLFGNTDDSATLERVELADATVDGNRSVGVLVGENNGTVRNSSASGTVNGPNGEVGGLVGTNYGDIIESSASVGVNGSSSLGGLVGTSRIGSTVTESYATGDIETPTASSVGGLVGLSNSATVNRSYATGNVTADESVGGVVGDSRTGGVGDPDGVITRTYATGNVTGNTNVGAVVGAAQGGFSGPSLEVTDSYWDNESTGQTDAVGGGFGATEENNSGLTTAEMTGVNATENMDRLAFTSTWHVTDSYPALAWEDTDPFYSINITATNTPASEGETLTVISNVTNWGADGSQTVTLNDTGFSDTERDAVDVTLAGGASNASVELEWTTADGDAGTGDVTVASENDTDTETVTIQESASFAVSINNVDEEVVAGEEVLVEYAVENTGEAEATQEVVFEVEGTQEASESVTLNGGQSASGTFTYATDAGNVPEIETTVASEDDSDTGTVTVIEGASFEVDLDVPAEPVLRGEVVDLEAEVANTGGVAGTTDVAIEVDGRTVESGEVSLSGGAETTVATTWDTSHVVLPADDEPSDRGRSRGDDGAAQSTDLAVTVEVEGAVTEDAVTVECIDQRNRSRGDPEEAVCGSNGDEGRDRGATAGSVAPVGVRSSDPGRPVAARIRTAV